jgi:hypothetical protein
MLPVASAPSDAPAEVISGKTSLPGTARLLAVAGLKPGRYVLKCGDQVVAAAPAEAWGSGVDIRQGPACEQTERLRQLIRLKNQDFFNYWRPENDTYIFGYRQREQGRNAVEIPRFEPLAVAKDAQIAEMRVPHPLTYSLSAEN